MTAAAVGDALLLPSGAVEVLPAEAPRAVWLAERRRSIGGSDASTLLGLNPYSSLMALWLDKTGQLPDITTPTSAMEWGVLLEPVVRDWFATTYDVRVARVGMWRRPGHPRLHFNPDGLVLDGAGRPVAGLEIKATNWRQAHNWADGQCPDHAELQAQLGMWLCGLPVWWVVGLIDGRDPQVRRVHADPRLQELIVEAAETFWRVHVEAGEAPALDGSDATLDAVTAALRAPVDGKAVKVTDELLGLFAAHERAAAAVKAAKEAEREAQAALRMTLGDAAMVVLNPAGPTDDTPEGRANVLATAVNNGTFSSSRFAAAEPELAARYTRDAPQLDVAALKTGDPEVYRAHCARVIRTRKPLTQLLDSRPETGRTA